MKIKHILATVAALVISTSVYATPQYSGDTFGSNGDFNTQKGSAGDQSGYYLWNDATSVDDWSVRWTGKGALTTGVTLPVDWFGSITFTNGNTPTGVSEFNFGGVDTLTAGVTLGAGDPILVWTAVTNATGGTDGFDFTLAANETILSFALGSELTNGLAQHPNDSGAPAGTGIYIGGAGGNWGITNVIVTPYAGEVAQKFEIALVPEPSVIALFGLGLVGLGFARRRSLNT